MPLALSLSLRSHKPAACSPAASGPVSASAASAAGKIAWARSQATGATGAAATGATTTGAAATPGFDPYGPHPAAAGAPPYVYRGAYPGQGAAGSENATGTGGAAGGGGAGGFTWTPADQTAAENSADVATLTEGVSISMLPPGPQQYSGVSSAAAAAANPFRGGSLMSYGGGR